MRVGLEIRVGIRVRVRVTLTCLSFLSNFKKQINPKIMD
jgi:hypothetical protein